MLGMAGSGSGAANEREMAKIKTETKNDQQKINHMHPFYCC